MDAGISGEYPQIMRFVNGLERDQTFFVIRAMALTGQQGGLVNLRLRVSTWLRPADAAASGLPPTPSRDASKPLRRLRHRRASSMAILLEPKTSARSTSSSRCSAVILGVGGWELYNSFSTPSTPVATAPVRPNTAATRRALEQPSERTPQAPQAQKLTNAGIDPTLHFDKLAQSEDVRLRRHRPQHLLRRVCPGAD